MAQEMRNTAKMMDALGFQTPAVQLRQMAEMLHDAGIETVSPEELTLWQKYRERGKQPHQTDIDIAKVPSVPGFDIAARTALRTSKGITTVGRLYFSRNQLEGVKNLGTQRIIAINTFLDSYKDSQKEGKDQIVEELAAIDTFHSIVSGIDSNHLDLLTRDGLVSIDRFLEGIATLSLENSYRRNEPRIHMAYTVLPLVAGYIKSQAQTNS